MTEPTCPHGRNGTPVDPDCVHCQVNKLTDEELTAWETGIREVFAAIPEKLGEPARSAILELEVYALRGIAEIRHARQRPETDYKPTNEDRAIARAVIRTLPEPMHGWLAAICRRTTGGCWCGAHAPSVTDASSRPHLINGEFQSDKYPTTPRGKVPLSVKDPTAQDLLWTYAQRRRVVDADFSVDLETALTRAGYAAPQRATLTVAEGLLDERVYARTHVVYVERWGWQARFGDYNNTEVRRFLGGSWREWCPCIISLRDQFIEPCEIVPVSPAETCSHSPVDQCHRCRT